MKKLQYIQKIAARIVNLRAKITSWDSIGKMQNTRVAIDVFNSLHDLLLEDLNGHFKIHQHKINTRGNGPYAILPKMGTDNREKSFAYQGARIFNQLEKTTLEETSTIHIETKTIEDFVDFQGKCN